MNEDQAYFLTVDWCNKGDRGIFCTLEGETFRKESPHTEDEMAEILGPFRLVLAPETKQFSEESLAEFNKWRPLAEYSNQYGIALKPLQEKGD